MKNDMKLDENAEIYKKRTNETEKQKLKGMSTSEKFKYFNDYYKNITLIFIILIVVVIGIAYTILSPKSKSLLYVAIVDDPMGEESIQRLTDEFTTLINLDLQSQNIQIDNSFFLDGEVSNVTMATEQKLVAYLYSKDIDVIIAEKDQFAKYVNLGYFENLSDRLPTDLYSDLSDSFFLSKEPEGSSIKTYGIYLDNSKVYQKAGTKLERPVIGIIANSQHKSYAVDFIRYLFDFLE